MLSEGAEVRVAGLVDLRGSFGGSGELTPSPHKEGSELGQVITVLGSMDQQPSILDEHDDASTTKYVLEHELARVREG